MLVYQNTNVGLPYAEDYLSEDYLSEDYLSEDCLVSGSLSDDPSV